MSLEIRRYDPRDESSWLRCRVLSFLDTDYFDDVWQERPDTPEIRLVAAVDGVVVGILDVEVEQQLATIDTVATHPDHRGRGIATALLTRALAELPEGTATLDAWTREDEPALAWYRTRGFAESDHYLHVYKSWEEPGDGWGSPDRLSGPITAFCHAGLEDEAHFRARFSRVHVCRRFSRTVPAS